VDLNILNLCFNQQHEFIMEVRNPSFFFFSVAVLWDGSVFGFSGPSRPLLHFTVISTNFFVPKGGKTYRYRWSFVKAFDIVFHMA
jgi:hypothetical protein